MSMLADRAANGAPAAPRCPASERLLLSTPAPPPTAAKWQIYVDLQQAPLEGARTLLFGDSLARRWPAALISALFPGPAFNLSVSADHIQHTLWWMKLPRVRALQPETVVIFAGANNLRAGVCAAAIALGQRALVAQARSQWPRARLVMLAVPARGEGFDFRDADRRALNALTRAMLAGIDRSVWVDLDEAGPPNPEHYLPDLTHFSPAGYEDLNRLMESKLEDGR
ncbi:Lysophospholipase L1 [Rhodoblastus acidophilus]|uniref:Lysophospholipase L1 n=1 Tax=Rhodoblastus acidophilus TaxID=1074 RepID=A0A212QGG0_RHOAC|nr:GDSL-type esterase/lipase family protein [Rhodoblastus acidophilus]MCW2316379.1 lysophospholipase L1-like esterase [Rhodoblastus acidophilus]PPQ40009.1 hypothetical protein CKO16_04210 [Rhodoblastus acidophilus]RAI22348.1 hypothetical protein CH337_05785 [Rhodoblastus acidophilus]SNB58432.1 Lysophospholipase L1 [Rhodoblastus acidophilus]